MNFIVIVSDSLRRDHVSCYGNQPAQWASGGRWSVQTPNIDRLAAMGSRFDNYYVARFPPFSTVTKCLPDCRYLPTPNGLRCRHPR